MTEFDLTQARQLAADAAARAEKATPGKWEPVWDWHSHDNLNWTSYIPWAEIPSHSGKALAEVASKAEGDAAFIAAARQDVPALAAALAAACDEVEHAIEVEGGMRDAIAEADRAIDRLEAEADALRAGLEEIATLMSATFVMNADEITVVCGVIASALRRARGEERS